MSTIPFLSIITINYNNAEGLRKTLESIKKQSSKNYEHIIIDGGSNDESMNVVREYLSDESCARQVVFWCSEKDCGVYNAMNKGIQHASGMYCNFLNSGDYFVDNDVIRRFESYNLREDIVYTNAIYFNSKKEWTLTFPSVLTAGFLYNDNLNHQNTLIKTEIQKQHLYNENYKINSDGEFFTYWILKESTTQRFIDDVIAKYEFETGISTLNYELYKKEKAEINKTLMQKPMLDSFAYWEQKYNGLLQQYGNLEQHYKKLRCDYDDYNECYKGILRHLRRFFRAIRSWKIF